MEIKNCSIYPRYEESLPKISRIPEFALFMYHRHGKSNRVKCLPHSNGQALIEAIAFLGLLVVPLLDELAGVEMGPAVAFVVDALAVEHLGPALAVQLRHLVEGQDIADDAGHDLGDRRAARHLDDGLVEDDFMDGSGSGRIGLRRLDAAPRRAGAPGNHGHRVGANLTE